MYKTYRELHSFRTMAFLILVVDDFEPFRRFVRSSLRKRAEFQITEASDGLEALQKIEQLQPDVILLDLGLPKLNGLEVCKCACRLAPAAKILFLSQEFSADVVQEAIGLGAHGYVYKLHTARDLPPAIDAVLKSERFVSSGLSAFLSAKGRKSIGSAVGSGAPPYAWQQTVADALESPPLSLPSKINIAERMIAARLIAPNQPDNLEWLALMRALRSLADLIVETRPQPQASQKKGIA